MKTRSIKEIRKDRQLNQIDLISQSLHGLLKDQTFSDVYLASSYLTDVYVMFDQIKNKIKDDFKNNEY